MNRTIQWNRVGKLRRPSSPEICSLLRHNRLLRHRDVFPSNWKFLSTSRCSLRKENELDPTLKNRGSGIRRSPWISEKFEKSGKEVLRRSKTQNRGLNLNFCCFQVFPDLLGLEPCIQVFWSDCLDSWNLPDCCWCSSSKQTFSFHLSHYSSCLTANKMSTLQINLHLNCWTFNKPKKNTLTEFATQVENWLLPTFAYWRYFLTAPSSVKYDVTIKISSCCQECWILRSNWLFLWVLPIKWLNLIRLLKLIFKIKYNLFLPSTKD